MGDYTLRGVVRHGLDNAVSNGYEAVVMSNDPMHLAIEMLDQDADVDHLAGDPEGASTLDERIARVVAVIREWRAERTGD